MTLGTNIVPEKIDSLDDFLLLFDHDESLGEILSFHYTQITCVDEKEDEKYWLFISPKREEGSGPLVRVRTGDGCQHKFKTPKEAIQCLDKIKEVLKNSKYKLTRDYPMADKDRPSIVYYWLPED